MRAETFLAANVMKQHQDDGGGFCTCDGRTTWGEVHQAGALDRAGLLATAGDKGSLEGALSLLEWEAKHGRAGEALPGLLGVVQAVRAAVEEARDRGAL